MEVASPSQVRRSPALSREFTASNVKLVRGGREYFDLLKRVIDEARESIHLQTYIYDDDETGKEIAERLVLASQRGVAVYLLADGYASQSLSSSFIKYIRDAGINFRFFEPIFRSKDFYFGRRLHHKILVADARCAVVGGINISNRYNDWKGEPAWLDFAVYVEGEIAKELCILCNKTWRGFPRKMDPAFCEPKATDSVPEATQGSLVRMRRNDWVRAKKQISSSYMEVIRNSKKEIIILCSYFLPGHEIRNQLIRAARRGVSVKVIVAGPSDVKIAKEAERFIYKELLENNIEVYEYQKTVLHGKIMVCDRKFLTIGSYNVNNISAYASIELNLDVYDEELAAQTTDLLKTIAGDESVQITKKWLHQKQTTLERIIEWSSYEIIRFLFYLSTFYFKQQA